MEIESMTLDHTSRIETSPKKPSHFNKNKSSKCGSLMLLHPMKENYKLPVKQTNRKERSPEKEKSKFQYIKNSKESSEKQSEEIHPHKQKSGRK